jgi:hypothetical protein
MPQIGADFFERVDFVALRLSERFWVAERDYFVYT